MLEILVVIVIIGILAVLLIAAISGLRARSQRVQCMANLKTLAVGANLYVQQNGMWPQIPAAASDQSPQDYANAWIAALQPFGVQRQSWICPTVQEALHNPDYTQAENARVDYFATTFDDKPGTSHEWPRQPWFAEIGNVHGNGNLMIFTDGSISDLTTAVQQGNQ